VTAPGPPARIGVEPGASPARTIFILSLTAFVDMVGQLMILPLLPFWTQRAGGSATTVGFVLAAFPLAQLVSSPLWGSISDRRGRRPVLALGLAASVLGYALLTVADHLWLLLVARLVLGAGGGTIGVIQATVADTTAPDRRVAALGWVSAATSLGVTLGPWLGSFATTIHRAAPGASAAALAVANLVLVLGVLPESRKSPGAGAPASSGMTVALRMLRSPRALEARLVWIYFVAMSAYSSMIAVMVLYLAARFGVTEQSIGFYYLYVGALAVVVRSVVLGWIAARIGESRLFRVGVACLAFALFAIPFAPSYRSLLAVVSLTAFGTAFVFPCVTARLSRLVPANQRGTYLGAQQTFGSIARIAAPVWACWAYAHIALSAPFLVASALTLAAALLWNDEPAAGTA
jgi:MFS family permease